MDHQSAIPVNRKLYIDIAKIIAICLVLFNHTGSDGYALFTARITSWVYFPMLFNAIFTKIAIPLFLMASGALLLGKEESYQDLLCKRFLKYLIVLVAASAISYFYGCFWYEPQALSAKFFWTALYCSYLTVSYWYLYSYLAFILMLPLLRKLAKAMTGQEYRWMFLLNGFIQCLSIFDFLIWKGENSHNSSFSFFITSFFVFYPLMGYYIDQRLKESDFTVKKLLTLSVISAIAIIICCLMTHYRYTITGDWDETFYNTLIFLPAITIFYGSKYLFLRWEPGTLLKKGIATVGQLTFGIYLINHICLLETYPIFTFLRPYLHTLPACWVWVFCAFLVGGCVTFFVKKIPGVRKFL